MRSLFQFAIIVLFLICANSFNSSRMKNRLPKRSTASTFKNDGVADVALLLDLKFHRKKHDITFAYLPQFMEKLSQSLPLNWTHMRLAVLTGHELKPDDYTRQSSKPLVDLNQGVDANRVKNAFDPDNLPKTEGDGKFTQFDFKGVKEVIDDAKAKAFGGRGSGDRLHAPDLTIYVGIFANMDNDITRWATDVAAATYQLSGEGYATMAILVSGFTESDWIDVRAGGTAREYTAGWSGLAEYISKKIPELLGTCKGVTVQDTECYYEGDNQQNCIVDRNFESIYKPVDKRGLCILTGSSTWPCSKGPVECENRCNAAHEKWLDESPCTCDGMQILKPKNLTKEEKKFYGRCGSPTITTSRMCPTDKSVDSALCSTTTPVDDERDIYVLPLPVWGILIIILCFVLMFTIVCTLIVYYCWFPPPKDYSMGASTSAKMKQLRWWDPRLGPGMAHRMMETYRERRRRSGQPSTSTTPRTGGGSTEMSQGGGPTGRRPQTIKKRM